jgi:hypothetical protein
MVTNFFRLQRKKKARKWSIWAPSYTTDPQTCPNYYFFKKWMTCYLSFFFIKIYEWCVVCYPIFQSLGNGQKLDWCVFGFKIIFLRHEGPNKQATKHQ